MRHYHLEIMAQCPLTADERKFYGACLHGQMDGVTCQTCPLLPHEVAVEVPVCTRGRCTAVCGDGGGIPRRK